MKGEHVGYLPAVDAALYAEALTELANQRLLPRVAARVWAARRPEYGESARPGQMRVVARVSIDLPAVHLIAPLNSPPSGSYRVLPQGRAVQVSGEEDHAAALRPFLRPDGEGWVYATLWEEIIRGKAVVQVRLNGAPVGVLSPRMSEDFLPAIRHLGETVTVARAIVKGNSVKADVVLYAARANELPESWLAGEP